ncbi:ribonucleotide-diphosphate reductase subunit rnr1 [Sarracenia purpurea var. burkii]
MQLDDALSATKLKDGRIKIWIHVADPASLVQPGSRIDREAMKRGTSVFLPTTTYPMFPERLAMEGMSLKQGKLCKAVTVSVVLHSDGRYNFHGFALNAESHRYCMQITNCMYGGYGICGIYENVFESAVFESIVRIFSSDE